MSRWRILVAFNLAWFTLYGCYSRIKITESASIAPTPEIEKQWLTEPTKAWEYKLPAPPFALLTFPNSRDQLLVTSFRGDLFLINLKTGKRSRRGGFWAPYRKPVQVLYCDRQSDLLYLAGINESKVYVYDLRAGEIKREVRLASLHGEGVLLGEYLYAVQKGRTLLKLDKTTLKIIAKRDLPALAVAGVFASNGYLAVLTDNGCWQSFQPDLTEAHKIDLGLNPHPVVADQRGVFLIADSKGTVVVLKDEVPIFRRSDLVRTKPIYAAPVLVDHYLYIAFADGEVVAADITSNQILWRWQGEGLVNQPIRINRSVLLVPYACGKVVALERFKGEPIWQIATARPLQQLAIFSDGILVADRDRKLTCWKW